jgi:hypothetical protein
LHSNSPFKTLALFFRVSIFTNLPEILLSILHPLC